MRHLWSLLAGLVLAPLTWVLVALGQSGSVRVIDGWDVSGTFDTAELIGPAAYLAAGGVLLGLLATLRVSPAGPVLAGLLLAGVYLAMFVNPYTVRDALPADAELLGTPLPLLPPLDNGTLLLIGGLLLVAGFSRQRWRAWPVAEPAAEVEPEAEDGRPIWEPGPGPAGYGPAPDFPTAPLPPYPGAARSAAEPGTARSAAEPGAAPSAAEPAAPPLARGSEVRPGRGDEEPPAPADRGAPGTPALPAASGAPALPDAGAPLALPAAGAPGGARPETLADLSRDEPGAHADLLAAFDSALSGRRGADHAQAVEKAAGADPGPPAAEPPGAPAPPTAGGTATTGDGGQSGGEPADGPATADAGPGQPAAADPGPGQPATADPGPGQPATAGAPAEPAPPSPPPAEPGPRVRPDREAPTARATDRSGGTAAALPAVSAEPSAERPGGKADAIAVSPIPAALRQPIRRTRPVSRPVTPPASAPGTPGDAAEPGNPTGTDQDGAADQPRARPGASPWAAPPRAPHRDGQAP